MVFLRRRLRVIATTWLVFQAGWLPALLPLDCCAAHRPAELSSHESAQAAFCPMRSADGSPCPMHRSGVGPSTHHAVPAEHDHGGQPSPNDCRLNGACGGPMAALVVLLSNHGILPHSTSPRPADELRFVSAVVPGDLVDRFQPPDSPPPRA